jgi:hypothetical protein
VPVKLTVGLLLALSLTVSVPDRTPAAVGANTTEIVQLPPAAKVLGLEGHVPEVVKSARLLLIELMVSDTV